MEKTNWADRVRNEVLKRDNEGRNILSTVERRKELDWSHRTYELPSETRY